MPGVERAQQGIGEAWQLALEGEAGAWKEMVSGGTSSDLTDRFIEQDSQISSAAAAMGAKKCATVAGAQ